MAAVALGSSLAEAEAEAEAAADHAEALICAAEVRAVLPGSLAEAAGLRVGDILLRVDEARETLPGHLLDTS